MNNYEAKPGACTPYSCINQLLNVDERFLINGQAYLLAPRSIIHLSALLSLLYSENISYSLMEKYSLWKKEAIFLSFKNLKRIKLLNEDKVDIEVGCSLDEIQSFLFERSCELGLESIGSSRQSIGELIFTEKPAGLKLHQLAPKDCLLAVEFVTLEGKIIKQKVFGSPLHEILLGNEELIGFPVKLTFKMHVIPPVRLYLSGMFEGWDAFDELLNFTSSWERLDCLISAKATEKGFVIGQISGLREEMEAFQHHCPINLQVVKEDKISLFKAYFHQKKAVYQPCQEYPLKNFQIANYYWWQGLNKIGWLIYL